MSDHKAENLPRRHPPESTKLHQFVAKNRAKIPGGMPPDPLTCVCYLLNAKYKFKQFFLQGVQLTYFENTPAIQNSTPLQKFLGTGLLKQ